MRPFDILERPATILAEIESRFRSDSNPPKSVAPRNARTIPTAALLLVVGWMAVVTGLLQTDAGSLTEIGLVSAIPVHGIQGFFLIALVAIVAIFTSDYSEPLAAASVASLVSVISAAPAIVYDTTRFSWAFKHVGIVDYLDRTGGVEPTIDILPVYHNWPGFFTGAGSLTRWLGFEDAIGVAAWAPVVLNLITLASLVFLFGSLTQSRRTIWLASLLFFVTNWIGQDYFSPQAVGYILYLNVIAIVLRFYRRSSYERPPFAIQFITTMMVFTIVISHQLTPLVLLVALVGLLVVRQTTGAWLPLVGGGLLIFWLGTWARGFVRENIQEELSAFGSPLGNAAESLSKAIVRSDAQEWVALSGRMLMLIVGLIAVIGLWFRYTKGENYQAPLALLAAPMVMLIMQFGGEILFRVALFMLPMLCLLAAEAIRSAGSLLKQGTIAAVVVVLFIPAFGLASFGKDSFFSFSANELEVAAELMATAPDNSLLIEGSRNYPSQFLEYEKFTYVPIERESAATQLQLAANPADELYRWMDRTDFAASYLLLTDSQHRLGQALGTLPPDFVQDVEAALRDDDRFEVLIDGTDAVVFVVARP